MGPVSWIKVTHMSTALTAKEDIRISFGEMTGGMIIAKAGETLTLVEDNGDTIVVKSADDIEVTIGRDKVQFS
uniref:Uncharacterized protein n=1 Tax=Pseudomonas phage RVTF4 TaxID=3236931 RepID=A0AB39CCM9_9VIRU